MNKTLRCGIVLGSMVILGGLSYSFFKEVDSSNRYEVDKNLCHRFNVILDNASDDIKTMHSAIKAISAVYNISESSFSNNNRTILFDDIGSRFVLMNDLNKTIEFREDRSNKQIPDSHLWKVTRSIKDIEYSQYLFNNNFLGNNGEITVKAGVDVGDNKLISRINFVGKSNDEDIIIRTYKGTIYVDSISSSIKHYGNIENVILSNSKQYTECGRSIILRANNGSVISDAGFIANVANAGKNVDASCINNGIIFSSKPIVYDDKILSSNIKVSNYDDISNYNYTINDNQEFQVFRDSVNLGINFYGVKVDLLTDIRLSPISNWTPIGIANSDESINEVSPTTNKEHNLSFNGSFNGNNHTISGLMVSRSHFGGLFGNIKDATIANLTVKGEVDGSNVAGLIGLSNNSVIKNINNYVNVTSNLDDNESRCSGIVAAITGGENNVVSNCVNYGQITNLINSNSFAGSCSGIIGCVEEGANLTVDNCINYGNINGNINQNSSISGGIIGSITSDCLISKCENHGDISGKVSGGIIGQICSHPIKISIFECLVSGTIIGLDNEDGSIVYAGEIVGLCSTLCNLNGFVNNVALPCDAIDLNANIYRNKVVNVNTNSNVSTNFNERQNSPYMYFKNGTFEINQDINYPIFICSSAVVTINGGNVTGKIENFGKLIINNGTFFNTLINYSNISIMNGSFAESITNYGDSTVFNGTFDKTFYNRGTLTIYNGSFNDLLNNSVATSLYINGGTFLTFSSYNYCNIRYGNFMNIVVINGKTDISGGHFYSTFSTNTNENITIDNAWFYNTISLNSNTTLSNVNVNYSGLSSILIDIKANRSISMNGCTISHDSRGSNPTLFLSYANNLELENCTFNNLSANSANGFEIHQGNASIKNCIYSKNMTASITDNSSLIIKNGQYSNMNVTISNDSTCIFNGKHFYTNLLLDGNYNN